MKAKPLFSRFLGSDPRRLHVAAHSHHPWPDVTFAAQQRAWTDAAAHHDDKWSMILDRVVPEAQGHIARILGLPDPRTITFAPNTHEFLLRILSCLPAPTRILTTDSEFHSFTRQVRRLEEDGAVLVQRIAAEPYATFAERFATAAAAGGHHLVFLSHVHFNSGYVTENLDALVDAADPGSFVVIDGYHGFMALPTDLSRVHARAFYLAGGYKYAMAGEGAAFLHCPPGYGPRPPDTGWYAEFGALTESVDDRGVPYATDGSRFAGATFDPSGLYRFNAVQRLLTAEGIGVSGIHAHVRALQERFLDRLGGLGVPGLDTGTLLPPPGVPDRGHFLTFRMPAAAAASRRLAEARVVTDHRGDRLRLGFGLYHDETDLDALCDRLVTVLGAHQPARGS